MIAISMIAAFFPAPALISIAGIGRKLHGFVERNARACAAAGEIENGANGSNHTSILHPVEEFLRALVNPAGRPSSASHLNRHFSSMPSFSQ